MLFYGQVAPWQRQSHSVLRLASATPGSLLRQMSSYFRPHTSEANALESIALVCAGKHQHRRVRLCVRVMSSITCISTSTVTPKLGGTTDWLVLRTQN